MINRLIEDKYDISELDYKGSIEKSIIYKLDERNLWGSIFKFELKIKKGDIVLDGIVNEEFITFFKYQTIGISLLI